MFTKMYMHKAYSVGLWTLNVWIFEVFGFQASELVKTLTLMQARPHLKFPSERV